MDKNLAENTTLKPNKHKNVTEWYKFDNSLLQIYPSYRPLVSQTNLSSLSHLILDQSKYCESLFSVFKGSIKGAVAWNGLAENKLV